MSREIYRPRVVVRALLSPVKSIYRSTVAATLRAHLPPPPARLSFSAIFLSQFVMLQKSLLLSRETRHSLPSPLLCQNSLFPPRPSPPLPTPRFPPQRNPRSSRPVSTPFPPVLTPPLPPSLPLLPPRRPSKLTFLTKSEITFVTRNSARPNP